nr:serine protease inhibitor 2.1-like [Anolis sagrei ordinatus]
MMLNFYLGLLLAGLICFSHCHHLPTHHEEGHDHQPPPEDHNNLSYLKIVPSNADFAFKFFHQVVSENAGKNVVFSPMSLSTAFALVSMGAKGATLNQLFSALGFNQTEISEQEIHEGFHYLLHSLNLPRLETDLRIGNALFPHDKMKVLQKFLDDAKHYYQADIFPTNFSNATEAEVLINSYIENKTQIKDVIRGLQPETLMVLVNYIFLKAYWKNPFNVASTQEDDFFVDEQTTVKVPMMNKDTYFKAYYDKDLSCMVVELPYKGDVSALFILPDRGKLKLVEDALGKDVLNKWKKSMREQRIDLFLPRFSIDSKYNVKEVLQRLGVTDVFENYADLSRITGEPELKVSKAIHKAHLNVYENGTEAAAVTVIEFVLTSMPPTVKFNTPFLAIISQEENMLFMAAINNPTEK